MISTRTLQDHTAALHDLSSASCSAVHLILVAWLASGRYYCPTVLLPASQHLRRSTGQVQGPDSELVIAIDRPDLVNWLTLHFNVSGFCSSAVPTTYRT